MEITAGHRLITVECDCRTCKTNATKLGLPVPLRAEATEAFVDKCGAHTAVYNANHPALGPAFRRLMQSCTTN